MERISYQEIERTFHTCKKLTTYKTQNLGDDKTFQSIKNKFKNYRFLEWLDDMRNEFNCQSYSHLISKIEFYHKNDYTKEYCISSYILFSAELDIANDYEIDYRISEISNFQETVNEALVNNYFNNPIYSDVYVKAEVDTKFYLNRELNMEDRYEEEQLEDLYDEGDDIIPPIETPFILDNCSVCLTAKPDILLIPCLHKSYCSECEERGVIVKCPTCRKIITKKVKI